MAPKKFERKDVFGEKKNTAPYVSASAAQRVYEDGGLSLPDEAFVDPVDKENDALKEQIAQTEAERELWRQQAEELSQQLAAQSNGIVIQDGGLAVQGFQFSPTGLIPPEQITQESWEQVGLLLFRLEGSIQWLLGDWLVYGTDLKYGDVKEIAKFMVRDEHTLYNYMSVSRSIESSRRRELVPYSHHQDVMGLTPEEQEIALAHAQKNQLNRKDFREWLRNFRGRKSVVSLPDGYQLNIGSVSREIEKLWMRDPSTAKRADHEKARQMASEAEAAIKAFKRKWGIE